ncbi:hypothetical protein Ancab_001088 [Ancistrocladus abbreviatus]
MTADNQACPDLPDCHYYQNQPILVCPDSPTPNHTLYLSNLDDQKFLRFSIKYIYLYHKAVPVDTLKASLSKLLSHYYPLAGRLRLACQHDDHKLEVDCNGEGAVFAEAFMYYTAKEFLQFASKPNRSWRKLLYRVDAQSFIDVPPLVIQVTDLRCGGMILCTAVNHCLSDGIGTSQFLNAWAHITTKPNSDLPITPLHCRYVLKPRSPSRVTFTHPGFTQIAPQHQHETLINDNQFLQSHPLVPVSLTFNSSQMLTLKQQISPSLKCTTFEALASHTWRAWARSLNLSYSLNVKLLFSVNVRKNLEPRVPEGYYGNAFVLGCAEEMVKDLVNNNLYHGVKLVQKAKLCITDSYIRSMIDLMEDKTIKVDLTASLIISQWSKIGLEDLDFGEGKPLHMGPLTSDVYCLFLPLVGELDSVRVLISLPETVAERFQFYMTEFLDSKENGVTNSYT